MQTRDPVITVLQSLRSPGILYPYTHMRVFIHCWLCINHYRTGCELLTQVHRNLKMYICLLITNSSLLTSAAVHWITFSNRNRITVHDRYLEVYTVLKMLSLDVSVRTGIFLVSVATFKAEFEWMTYIRKRFLLEWNFKFLRRWAWKIIIWEGGGCCMAQHTRKQQSSVPISDLKYRC
jgi:hypothetical protein